MTAIGLQSLPLGFRFHPKDEELVNHYLKRKITGRIKSDEEVIPEIDVCKLEPWDIPAQSLIKSEDPEWFFFAPKDRKYPNGHRSNRATKVGYWKATGRDRVIRSSGGRGPVIGMKKTLVFHRGRAPKGVRTNWIMHEYRTTEPEFESGEQGGYVLYRLFDKKPEEKGSNSNIDGMEINGFSPDGNNQPEPDVVEEIEIQSNHYSPNSDLQEEPQSKPDCASKQPASIAMWLADKGDCSTSVTVKPEMSDCNLVSPDEENQESKGKEQADPLQDIWDQVCDVEYEQVGHDLPNVGSTLHPSCPVSNDHEDPLNEFLNSILNSDDGSNSDLDIERNPLQCASDFEAFGWFPGSSPIPTDQLPLGGSAVYPGSTTELSALYEDDNLFQCDVTGPDVYSVDFGAESLQDLCNIMEESSNQRSTSDSKDDFEVTGISIRSRPTQQLETNSDNLFFQQGTAERRLRLEGSIRNVPFASIAGEPSSRTNGDDGINEPITRAIENLTDGAEEPTTEENTIDETDDAMATGVKIRARHVQHSSSKFVTQQEKPLRKFNNRCKLQTRLAYSESSIENNNEDKGQTSEAVEHVGDNNSEVGENTIPAVLDKLEELTIHDKDETPSSSNKQQESESTLRSRKKLANDCDNTLEHSPAGVNKQRESSVVSYIFVTLSVALVLLCFGIWSMSYQLQSYLR